MNQSRAATDDTLAADVTGEGSPRREAPPLLAGRYELLGMLGTGGMGSVYRARDRELDELVAVKMLHAEIGDSPTALERFRRELKLARRVTHPNVARAFDIGEHDGRRFLTMELVDGESLGELLARRGRLPVGEVIAIAKAVGEGMAAAHLAGVVHRDLKPDNVLIDKGGRVVVTDFGVARGHATGAVGGTAGHIVGTPAYMAPEQVEALPDVDHRADLYALGEIIYELLAGERAWPGEHAYAVAAARLVSPPPDVRACRPDVPEPLAAIVLRCLARDRTARFASAREVIDALDGLAEQAAPKSTTGDRFIVPAMPAHDRTVAVIPFVNHGPEGEAYVADGLTEDLIDALSTTRGLRVLARAPAASADARTTGHRLGVDVIVEGSVRRVGELVRIRARLVSVADGFQLWAERFERPIGELLVVTDEAVYAIATALCARAADVRRAPLSDPEAVEHYLRARQLDGPDGDRAACHAAYEAALARAPDDPSILAAYATALSNVGYGGVPGAAAQMRRALEIARKAVAAAPGQPDTWLALAQGKYRMGDSEGAMADARRALMLAPGHEGAAALAGRLLLEVGPLGEAVGLLERSLHVRSSDVSYIPELMRGYALQGRWNDVVAALSRASTPLPTLVLLLLLRTSLWHGSLLAEPGEREIRDPGLQAAVGVYDAVLRTRELDEASAAVLDRIIATAPPGSRPASVVLQGKTEFLAFVGRADEAEEALRQTVLAGLIDINWMDHCCVLASLRARPSFSRLRAQTAERAAAVLAGWQR